jgi:ATP-binding cassette subfamily C protein LapB
MMVWGVFLVMSNTITVGGLIAANMLAGRVLGPLTNLAALIARGSQTIVAMRAIDKLMQLETERTKGKVYTARKITKGSVEFDSVKFRYPNAVRDALSGVSFKVAPGERVGIVGQIGSGKTTVGRLMVALYEPDEGRILIDGADVRQYDPSDLREGIGFGLQEVDLFFGTLRENISISNPAASDAEVLEAARLAGVESFAAQHPHGYDMMLAEGGKSLSGGQRQSIALARVLLRKPKVLFLDEPTSALDMKSEADFCDRLNAALPPETSLIVCTHRVSLLRFVNRLIVFENGRIAIDGPRDEVLASLRKPSNPNSASMVG